MIPGRMRGMTESLFEGDSGHGITLRCSEGITKKAVVSDEFICTSMEELEDILNELGEAKMHGNVSMQALGGGKVKVATEVITL